MKKMSLFEFLSINLFYVIFLLYLCFHFFYRKNPLKGDHSQTILVDDYFQKQSIPVNDDENERKLRYYDGEMLLTYLHEDATTLLDSLKRATRLRPDEQGIGSIDLTTKQINWHKYEDVLKRAKHFGDGLMKLGQTKKSIVGIYSENRLEYIIAEYGCYWHSMVIAPIYNTLGPNIATFIANQAEIEVIVCDTLENVQSILLQAANYTHLKYIVAMDHVPISYCDKATNYKLKIYSVQEVEKLGVLNTIDKPNEPTPKDMAVICYTSGTTGQPKGVMLTHENIIASTSGLLYQMFEHKVNKDDLYLSYLPLGHIMERVAEVAMFMTGATIVFNTGGILNLLQNIQLVRPTVFLTVPRLVNKIYEKINKNIRGNIIKKFMFNKALAAKRKAVQQGKYSNNTLWDKIIFDKIRASLGGRVRVFSTGSASLDPHVAEVLRCVFNCVFLNGYGQSECSSCSMSLPFDDRLDHVGPPLASAMIKLKDIPHMDYFVSDGKGEILVKGPIVTEGYFKNDAETKLLFDEDGWLKTGDVGCWTKEGTLQIIDRKKNFFKLSQGEYIAVEKLSNAYSKSLFVSQLFVYGDSKRSFLVAIVVPDKEYLEEWCLLNHIQYNIPDLCKSKRLITAILDDFKTIAKDEQFNKLEYVKNILIHPDMFTIEDNLLTPTMKIKRHEIQKKFTKEIETLYKNYTIYT